MSSPLILTEYACEKPCKYCRLTQKCPRVSAETGAEHAITERLPAWFPNREKDTLLRCGCLIPWPIVQAFGQRIHGQVWCSQHGWQAKLTETDIKNARKVARKEAGGQTEFADIPPF